MNIAKIKVIDEIISLKFNNIKINNILSALATLKTLNLKIETTKNFFENYQALEGRGKFSKLFEKKI